MATLSEPPVRPAAYTGSAIDADVHAFVPSLDTLRPYLAPEWRQWADERSWGGPLGGLAVYPPNAPSTVRAQWRPGDGTTPASTPELLAEHVLDPWQTERAVLNCYYAVDSVRHPDMAAALAAAVNDWVAAEWLGRDERLRASIVVPARDPAAMISEIERVGDHPGFVQVLMPVRTDRLYGNRAWHPLYAAMAARDLVMGIHWGGTPEGPPSPTGYPTTYVEEYGAEWQAFMPHLTSMITEGVFQAVPDLRVSFLESGFTWLPFWSWRINKEWKGLRREVPWVTEPPIELIRRHMRFSTAPTHVPTREDLARTIEWIDSDDLLMFASDYPHRHDDDVAMLIDALPVPSREKVMADNARRWYRLEDR